MRLLQSGQDNVMRRREHMARSCNIRELRPNLVWHPVECPQNLAKRRRHPLREG